MAPCPWTAGKEPTLPSKGQLDECSARQDVVWTACGGLPHGKLVDRQLPGKWGLTGKVRVFTAEAPSVGQAVCSEL